MAFVSYARVVGVATTFQDPYGLNWDLRSQVGRGLRFTCKQRPFHPRLTLGTRRFIFVIGTMLEKLRDVYIFGQVLDVDRVRVGQFVITRCSFTTSFNGVPYILVLAKGPLLRGRVNVRPFHTLPRRVIPNCRVLTL